VITVIAATSKIVMIIVHFMILNNTFIAQLSENAKVRKNKGIGYKV
jgi:hypothetical protein